jgi:polar amino acid transport system permease protein
MMFAGKESRRLWVDFGVGFALVAAFCALVWWVVSHLDTAWGWQKTFEYRGALLRGWWLTLQISLGALVGSCLVAGLLLAAQRAPLRSTRWASRVFIEIVRGMPLLVLLLIGYYVIFAQSVVSRQLDAIGLGSKVFMGTALLSIFTGAYVCEILRGGLESIPHGQIDSARAVGFNRTQVLRYVVMPQALRRVLPALAGKFVDLVKDSSLLTVIGVDEFTSQARAMNSATYGGIEAFLPLAVGYLVLTLALSGLAHVMESRFRYQM